MLYGGVVPEIASRNHVKDIVFVINKCLKDSGLSMDDIDAIAVTYGPGLVGSLLVGLEAAKTISYIFNKPLVPVHHIRGHIYANSIGKDLTFPLLALIISGGHTELLYMKDHFDIKKIGSTLDDAVGECYDKVARVIGIPYPGGPMVDKLAHEGHDNYSLPVPLDDDSFNFSFSGLKSAVINLVHNEEQRGNEIRVADMCTTFQNRVVSVITKKTIKALKEYNCKNLVLAGGVAANSGLREKLNEACLKENINFSYPRIAYCTDNAAMIGAAAYYAHKKGKKADLTLNAVAVETLYNE